MKISQDMKRKFALVNALSKTELFVRESTGERGATGYYMLTDWGILDRSSFLNRYGKM